MKYATIEFRLHNMVMYSMKNLSDWVLDVGNGQLKCKNGVNEHKQFKGIVHPKMKMLSSLTHPQVVTNLYKFLSSFEHKKKDILKNVGNQTSSHWLP